MFTAFASRKKKSEKRSFDLTLEEWVEYGLSSGWTVPVATQERIDDELKARGEATYVLDGLDGAFLGFSRDWFSDKLVAVYSLPRIISILKERDGMTDAQVDQYIKEEITERFISSQMPILVTPIVD